MEGAGPVPGPFSSESELPRLSSPVSRAPVPVDSTLSWVVRSSTMWSEVAVVHRGRLDEQLSFCCEVENGSDVDPGHPDDHDHAIVVHQ